MKSVIDSIWEGYRRKDFSATDRDCILVFPTAPAHGNPWIWRTEFFGAWPQADVALLSQGYHVAYIDVHNTFGAPRALDVMDKFYTLMLGQYGLSERVVLEGFSRGGLLALNYAARHPTRVASLYLDAPVCDFKSWPGGKGKGKGSPDDWKACLDIYNLTEEEAIAYPLNPIDNLRPLAEVRIPILSVCGDSDDIVPMAENTELLESRYRQLGGDIRVIVKKGVGHHPHSLQDITPIVEFIFEHASNKVSKSYETI
jgi:pimeloyl-ACP methyl ester carboxylesterase